MKKTENNTDISHILNHLDMFPVQKGQIYQNGTLLFEGEYLRVQCNNSKVYILDKTGEYIFIESILNLTYIYNG